MTKPLPSFFGWPEGKVGPKATLNAATREELTAWWATATTSRALVRQVVRLDPRNKVSLQSEGSVRVVVPGAYGQPPYQVGLGGLEPRIAEYRQFGPFLIFHGWATDAAAIDTVSKSLFGEVVIAKFLGKAQANVEEEPPESGSESQFVRRVAKQLVVVSASATGWALIQGLATFAKGIQLVVRPLDQSESVDDQAAAAVATYLGYNSPLALSVEDLVWPSGIAWETIKTPAATSPAKAVNVFLAGRMSDVSRFSLDNVSQVIGGCSVSPQPVYTALVHELIHLLRVLKGVAGTAKADFKLPNLWNKIEGQVKRRVEEAVTVIGDGDWKWTENAVRDDLGLPPRETYFSARTASVAGVPTSKYVDSKSGFMEKDGIDRGRTGGGFDEIIVTKFKAIEMVGAIPKTKINLPALPSK